MLDVRPGDDRSRNQLEAMLICRDGLLEPKGRSQLLPYITALRDSGVDLTVLSFESIDDLKDGARVDSVRATLRENGVSWTPLGRRPGAGATRKVLELSSGIVTALRLARRRHPHVIHARGFTAGLIALLAKAWLRARFVVDLRGFWPEERVELGLLHARGLRYRLGKHCERILIACADHTVVPTESAKAILRDREASARLARMERGHAVAENPISVIPAFSDLERMRPRPADRELEREFGLSDHVVIGNIGGVNQRYMLLEMLRFAFHVKSHRPKTRFVYVTRRGADRVRACAREAGLRDEDVLILDVDPDDIPRWLSLFRCGVFFLRPSYAAKASSLAKLADFLACGVPVVTNKGVGDLDSILGAHGSCVLVPGLRDHDLKTTAKQILPLLDGDEAREDVVASCRATAETHFALDAMVERYVSIYVKVAFPESVTQPAAVAVSTG